MRYNTSLEDVVHVSSDSDNIHGERNIPQVLLSHTKNAMHVAPGGYLHSYDFSQQLQ